MQDIESQANVRLLLDTFYDKIKQDNLLGPIFKNVIGDKWLHHMSTMYKFWDMVLLSKAGYEGYPTKKHTDIDRKTPLEQEHFERWLSLWNQTIDGLFQGPIATEAKDKAKLMSNLISMKVEDSRGSGFIQ